MELRTSKGVVFLIDDEDFDRVTPYKWTLHPKGYVFTRAWTQGKYKTIYMHRLLTQAPPGMQVDHINGNGLDNRKENLRLVTRAQNGQNRKGAPSHSATGVRGVRADKNRPRKYRADLTVNGKRVYLGAFRTLEEAEKAAVEGRKKHMTHSRN